MKEEFFDLSERLAGELRGEEVLLCNLSAERSDFVRFNQGKVRQAGSVEQRLLGLRLVRGRRQAGCTLTLAGGAGDVALVQERLAALREDLGELPEDPWLLINEVPRSSESARRGTIADAHAVVQAAVRAAGGRDLVGFYAGGTLYRGFANSLGQRNWHEVDSFNFDWSLYLRGDRAVKGAYAGMEWDAAVLEEKVAAAAAQLALLDRQPRLIVPGEYRAYLAPRALEEVMGLLCWGAFSARARHTRQSPLLRMESGAALSPRLMLRENTAEGTAPAFQPEGFVKPAQVDLIRAGALGDPLVSPRSAREYELQTNGASGAESPESLDLAGGGLAASEVLAALDTGLYVNNLWYLNYSDRPAARITGMTRFATFWVEGGRIAAPVTPMRFDDSLFRMLGENLVDLTREREWLPDPSTYGERSVASMRLPGALLSTLRFTL